MELRFQDKKAVFNENIDGEKIAKQINDWLREEAFFSHFVADGVEVYEDPAVYLNGDLSNVDVLEVKTKSKRAFVTDLLLTAEEYTKNAIPLLHGLAEALQTEDAQLWSAFLDFLDGAQWLKQMVQTIDQSSERPTNWDDALVASAGLEVVLNKLGPFVQQENKPALATILQTEVVALFEQLHKVIQTAIDQSSKRPGAN